MILEELKKEYMEQENRCTAWPFYVIVQEKFCAGVIGEGYDVNCPYGDGEAKMKYIANPGGETSYFTSIEEAVISLSEAYGDDLDSLKDAVEEIQEVNLGYIWRDVEIFLTVKGANEFIESDKHNHGELRTYIKPFHRKNHEMRGMLEEVGFKVKDWEFRRARGNKKGEKIKWLKVIQKYSH